MRSGTVATYATQTVTVSLSPNILLGPGDTLTVSLYRSASDWQYYLSSDGSGLGGVLTITPVSGSTGSLTTVSRSLPACQEIIAWVRHRAGQTTFSAGGRALEKMSAIERICEMLPALDCGFCGAPTCRAFAEDVVRGECAVDECIVRMRERVQEYLRTEREKEGTER